MAGSLLPRAEKVSFAGIDDLKSGRHANSYVVNMQVNAADIKPGRDRELIITPVLKAENGTESITLPTIRVSGRNRYFSHLRNNDLPAGEKVLQAGEKEIYNYHFETPWESWMDHSDLNFDTETAHCCDAPAQAGTTRLAHHDYGVPEVALEPKYVALTGDSTIVIEAQGQAFVDFVVNRTELKPDYRGNRKEIDKILRSIDVVAQDPDAIITRITIKGFASPEGSYSNNVRLAMGRTNTLKEYVSKDLQRRYRNFNPEVMMTDYEPEDWDGLRRFLESCSLPNRHEILAIANDLSLEPDPRNSKIQNLYPREYKLLLDSVYPGLRHSDYTIRYSIKTDIDVDHLKEMLVKTPERLRPIDFYLIASTYPVGSEKYNEAMLKAVEIYPTDEEAALNAANIYLARGDMKNARLYSERTGHTPAGIYTRANVAAREGDLEKAANLLREAIAQGYTEAVPQLEEIEAILARDPVTYY